jgi:hypothetical protein
VLRQEEVARVIPWAERKTAKLIFNFCLERLAGGEEVCSFTRSRLLPLVNNDASRLESGCRALSALLEHFRRRFGTSDAGLCQLAQIAADSTEECLAHAEA